MLHLRTGASLVINSGNQLWYSTLVFNSGIQLWYSTMILNGPNSPSLAAPEWVIGLDIGQRRDYSAIAVLDWAEEGTGRRDPATYEYIRRCNIRLRHAERVHLGTPFHGLVNRISEMLQDP